MDRFSMDVSKVKITFQENTRVKKTNEDDLYTKHGTHKGIKGSIITTITTNMIRKIVQILTCQVMRK
jgi:hypothetical protein